MHKNQLSLQAHSEKEGFFRAKHPKLRSKIVNKKVLKQKKRKKVRKRNEKRKTILKCKNIKLFGINAAGIKSKLKSFNEVLKRIEPKIWMVQETKLKPNEEYHVKQ